MRITLLLLFITGVFYVKANGQKIIIDGKETNRKLAWSDFTGKPDPNSSFFAYTWWKLSYSYSGTEPDADSVRVKNFDAKLQLDKEKSWVKKGRETDELLVHEQGHFNVGILCVREMVATMNAKRFPREGLQAAIQSTFNEVLQKYKAMGQQYDSETQHGNNKEVQEQWNSFFKERL
jgi:hypothetical protein